MQKTTEPSPTHTPQSFKNGRLLHNHKFFVSSKAFPRAYKFFSSLNFYHAARKSSEEKFQSIFNQVKYIKRLNIPMVLNIKNSHKISKKLKFINKGISHSTNLLSFALNKGKSKGYQERAFKNPTLISEVFITKNTSLRGLKYCRNLQILRLDLQHRVSAGLTLEFFRLFSYLKKLKSLFVNTSSPTKEIFSEFIACICKKLPALEELYLGTDKWFEKSEELGIEKLNVQRLSLRQNGFSTLEHCQNLVEVLSKNDKIKELQFLAKTVYLRTWQEVEKLLGLYGYELEASVKEAEFKDPMTVEKPEYVLKIYRAGFTLIKK